MSTYEKLKISVFTCFAIGFLYCLYGFSENGRYTFPKGGSDYNAFLLIDTRTGEIYNFRSFVKTDLKKYRRIK